MAVTVKTPAEVIPTLPGLLGSHIWYAGMAVLVELGVGVVEAERLGVDVWLAVKERVGELEGVANEARPVMRNLNADAAMVTAPAERATVIVKGYTGGFRVTGCSVLGGLATGGLRAGTTAPVQYVTPAPLRRRYTKELVSSTDVSTCTDTGLLLV